MTARYSSKPAILDVAVSLAKEKGLRSISRELVAHHANVASATVSYHFGKMDDLRKEVVKFAITHEILSILADARSDRNSKDLFTRMNATLKQKVAEYVAS